MATWYTETVNDRVWTGWHTPTVTSAATSTTAWDYWCTGTSSSSTTCTSAWTTWCDDETISLASRTPTVSELPAQIEARQRVWERQRAEYEAQLAKEREERVKAEARARELLLSVLRHEQREQFERDGHFLVTGRSGRRYRLRPGRVANVDVIDRAGRVTHRLCAHPAPLIPDCDTLVAQKLMLEHDDEAFTRIANRHSYNGGPTPVAPALH